jgi:hypothetical protein
MKLKKEGGLFGSIFGTLEKNTDVADKQGPVNTN